RSRAAFRLRNLDARLRAPPYARPALDVARRGRGPSVPARPRPLSGIDRRRRARTRRDLPTRRSGTSPAARSGGGVQFRATPRDRHARERPARAGLDLPVSRATESGGPHPGRGLPAGGPPPTSQGPPTGLRTPLATTAPAPATDRPEPPHHPPPH